MCCRCSVKQQKLTYFSIAGVLFVLGIVMIAAWRSAATAIIDGRLKLTPDSYVYDQWVDTPVPVYIAFSLYNWTNPHEVGNPNIKPNFVEMGPYAFRDVKHKEDLIWDDENSAVTFYGRRTFYFDEEVSKGSLDDLITVPHFPSVSAAKVSRKKGTAFRKITNFTLATEGGKLYTTHTALEWIFSGFCDDLLEFVALLHSPLLPLESGDFAWFYGRNGSKEAEGTYTIHTGQKDLSKMGDLLAWKGENHTGFWEGECGKVNGSTGELWSPHKKFDDVVSIFMSDSARFINLFPTERIKYRGVDVFLYNATNQTYDNGYIAPDTKCFCVPGNECPKNGVIDFSPVTYGAPIYLSHPHFYMADPSYLENTTGLKPDPIKHNSYVILEPVLAVPMELDGRVMLSLLVEQDEAIDIFRDIAHDFYAPLVGIQMAAEITDDLLDYVKLALSVPDIGQYIGIGLAVVGFIMISIGLWLSHSNRWGGENKKAELDNEGTERALGTQQPPTEQTVIPAAAAEKLEPEETAQTVIPAAAAEKLEPEETSKTVEPIATAEKAEPEATAQTGDVVTTAEVDKPVNEPSTAEVSVNSGKNEQPDKASVAEQTVEPETTEQSVNPVAKPQTEDPIGKTETNKPADKLQTAEPVEKSNDK